MEKSIILGGRIFTVEFIEHLNVVQAQQPDLSNNALARVVCEHLAWFSPDGRAAVSSAKVAVRKLRDRGLLRGGAQRPRRVRSHRLQPSGESLPPVQGVPGRVDQVRGLCLYLISGCEDALHGRWNDLIIQQHPCGDAPLVGAQLRYLIGSEHGWLGALGFGPAAFVLGARDQWIGWSSAARVGHLGEVVGLARFLIRREVRCAHLASKVLSLALRRLPADWAARYGVTPVVVETFVDRTRFTGRCFAAANWRRIGTSTGQGRLGPKVPCTSPKDIWVYALTPRARERLQQVPPPPLLPTAVSSSLAQSDWCAHELATLDLGDVRRHRRAEQILAARWAQPQASFYGSFTTWAAAKAAYGLIEHASAPLSLAQVLAPHAEATQARMAAEPVVLLPQDTSSVNYAGLRQTRGLGPINHDGSRGLFLHSLLAYRLDGVPLGVLQAQAWARPPAQVVDARGRNAKSLDEKESVRWLAALRTAAAAAQRMPQTQLAVLADREGDLYELHEAVQLGPPNLHVVVRAQHDRNLPDHQKLWAFMAARPGGDTRAVQVPRRRGQPARVAQVQLRWSAVTIEAPQVGGKKGWPPLRLAAVWVHEPQPPPGVAPLEWMLLTDLPVLTADQAWEKVQWYRRRWGIEEWHRVLKSGCNIEGREFKDIEQLQRVLAFDLIVGWRVLACLKLGRALPQLDARVLYTEDELAVLRAALKKTSDLPATPHAARRQPVGGALGRPCRPTPRRRARTRKSRAGSAPAPRSDLGLASA
jgi:hypothetical protein